MFSSKMQNWQDVTRGRLSYQASFTPGKLSYHASYHTRQVVPLGNRQVVHQASCDQASCGSTFQEYLEHIAMQRNHYQYIVTQQHYLEHIAIQRKLQYRYIVQIDIIKAFDSSYSTIELNQIFDFLNNFKHFVIPPLLHAWLIL